MCVNGFESFIAWRYLLARKKTGFISIISLISIAGIALGVAALIIVLSLMNGFSKELRTRLVGMQGHIWVSSILDGGGMRDYEDAMDTLESIPGVTGASPFCVYKTVLMGPSKQNQYAAVDASGTDLSTIGDISDIRDYITDGYLDFSTDEDGIPGIVIGWYVAQNLGVYNIGDKVYMMGMLDEDGMNDILGGVMPPLIPFRVTGMFSSGYYDYDNSVVLIDMKKAQEIMGYDNKVSGISLKIEDAFAAEKYTEQGGLIEQELGKYPYFSSNWIVRNKTLFSWMQLEKWAAFIVLSLIILVAAFNIVSSLIMMVMDKTREIGILKSMGASKASIQRIFVYQGAFVGISGTLLGSVIGYTVCMIQDKYRILSLPADVYFVSAVPVELQMSDFLAITIVAMLLCWVSSVYPARKASMLDPVDAIRAE